MFKKTILSIMIGATLQVQAESADKFVIPAGRPSIKQASHSTANQLVLAVGSFDPLYETLDFSKSKIISEKSSKYTIVQFEEGKADSIWLQNQGIEVLSYLPNNAFIIASSENNIKVLNNKNVRWHGPYLSQYKIAPELWTKSLKPQASHGLNVKLFNDFPHDKIQLLFRKYLPHVNIKSTHIGSGHSLIISTTDANIDLVLNKLASIDAVQFVEKVKPQKFLNTEAVPVVQANGKSGSAIDDNYTPTDTPIWDKGLIGSGQIVGVADSGLDSNEDWFVHYDNGSSVTHVVTEAEDSVSVPSTNGGFNTLNVGTTYPDRKVFGYFVMPGAEKYDEEGADFHGTHVTGSIAGDRLEAISSGPAGSISSPFDSGYDNDDGMAPNAQILFQDIGSVNSDGVAELSGQGSLPMWKQAYNAGVRIHSNSYGSDGDGAYSFSDLFADETLHELEDMLIVFAAGNDGTLGLNSIGSPANGKNVLSVGASQHGSSNGFTGFSSRGPTDDGRLKPDIMAPGASIESAAGNLDHSTTISSPQRATLSGTSMATPITAGSAALMRQYFTDGFYPTGIANPADAHNPTGPLMKAVLINGAGINRGSMPYKHFDNLYGWGRVFLSNSIMFYDSDKQLRVWEVSNPNGIKTDESLQFKLGVKADQNLAVTLTWYDVPGPFGSSKTLVNDLDLTVEVNGEIYKGNNFSDVGVSSSGGTRDSINSVEQVRIPTPIDGIYTITVKGANVPGDGSLNSIRQGFAIAATGHFDNIDSNPPAMSSLSNLSAITLGNNGIQLNWDGGANADYFEIYKVEGTCATADFSNLRFTGNSESNTFTDFRTLNGKQYAYKIRAGQYKGLGQLASTCVDITSEQACDFLPTFKQSSINISDNVGDLCHSKIQWSAATNSCDANTPISKYNIYRSSDPNFIPGPNNLLTTVSTTSYDDIRAPSEAAYYTIRAEDNGTTGSGPNGGTETNGTAKIRSQAIGTGFTSGPVFEDVDNVAIMNLSFPWQVVSNKAADGVLSYKTGEAGGNYPPSLCSSMTTNTISLTGDLINPSLDYKALYNFEQNWDGVVVEISTDDGATWSDFPPDGGYPGDFSETTDTPVNACGFASTHGAFSGSNNDTFEDFSHDLTPFIGQDIKLRWRLSSDPASEFEGFYLDSINYPNIQIPNACMVNTAPLKPEAGLYYDRGRNGHGFVIEPISNSDLYFTVFYTYKDDGTPEWYTSLSLLENNVLNMNLSSDPNNGGLTRFIYDFNVDPTGNGNPNTLDTSVGQSALKIDFNSDSIANTSACTDGQSRGDNIALATWQLGNQQGEWCIEPLSNVIGAAPNADSGGTWWTGIDDDGWGLSLSFTEGSNTTIVVTIYYFDSTGHPRWVQGIQTNFVVNQEMTIDMLEFTGYGRDATPIDLSNSSTGSLGIKVNSNGIDGTINLDIDYQGNEAGNWKRLNTPITIFTAPHQ